MRKLTATIAAAALGLSATPAFAAGEVTLQGVKFDVDTLECYFVGPQVTKTHLRLKQQGGTRAVSIHAITAKIKGNKNVRPKVVLGNDSCRIAETLSSMGRRKTTANTQMLAGVNADYFITSGFTANHPLGNAILGYPNMSCVIDGKLAAPDLIDKVSREKALIITADTMYMDCTDQTYRVYSLDDAAVYVNAYGVNYPRTAEQCVVYNSFMGKYTGTDQTGREITLRIKNGAKFEMNKVQDFEVISDWRQGGNSPIPQDGLVISLGPNYTHKNLAFLDALKPGSGVRMKIFAKLPYYGKIQPQIQEMVGGDVRVLREDTTCTTADAIRFINTPTAAYGRSLTGYDKHRTTLWLVAIDAGGSSASSGLSYFESADMMRWLGCYDALMMDGGGSTAMWTHYNGIVNNLRDGSERAIGNGLFIQMDTPYDKEVASLQFAERAQRLPKFGRYVPAVYGYNQYGQLVDRNVTGYTLEAPAELGVTDNNGTPSLLASGNGCHALTVRKGNMTATMPVTVDSSVPATPAVTNFVIDNTREWPIELYATVANKQMAVAPEAYTWTVADATVASVSADGKVRGIKNGVTAITGVAGDNKVELQLTVENPSATTMPVFSAIDNAEWKFTGTSTSTQSMAPLGDNGFTLAFNVTSTRGPRCSAARDTRLWGRPEAIEFAINPAAHKISAVEIALETANGGSAKVKYTGALNANADNVVRIPLSDFVLNSQPMDASDATLFPLTFKTIALYVSGTTGRYTVNVPRFDTVYPGYTGTIDAIAEGGDLGGTLRATQRNGRIVLGFVASSVEVYNVAGARIASAANTDAVAAPTPGLYVLRAVCNGKTLTGKIAVK